MLALGLDPPTRLGVRRPLPNQSPVRESKSGIEQPAFAKRERNAARIVAPRGRCAVTTRAVMERAMQRSCVVHHRRSGARSAGSAARRAGVVLQSSGAGKRGGVEATPTARKAHALDRSAWRVRSAASCWWTAIWAAAASVVRPIRSATRTERVYPRRLRSVSSAIRQARIAIPS